MRLRFRSFVVAICDQRSYRVKLQEIYPAASQLSYSTKENVDDDNGKIIKALTVDNI